MAELTRIILFAFSVYRLSSLLALEEGPYLFFYRDPEQRGIFQWLRTKLGAYDYIYDYDELGNSYRKAKTNLGRGVSCPLCVGAYVSIFMMFILYAQNTYLNLIIVWLGVWGIQTFLESITTSD